MRVTKICFSHAKQDLSTNCLVSEGATVLSFAEFSFLAMFYGIALTGETLHSLEFL